MPRDPGSDGRDAGPTGGEKPTTRSFTPDRDPDVPVDADAKDDEAETEQDDAAFHGFEPDPFDERLGAAADTFHRFAMFAGRLWSHAILPFEFLFALWRAFAEARLIQSSDRRLRDLLQALPAVMMVAGALVVTIAGAVRQRGLAAEYRSLAAQALDRADYKAAHVYAGREHDLDGSGESLFRFAEAAGRLGDSSQAERLMRRLADEADHGPAHLWIADRSLADPATLRDAGRLAEVATRLRQAEAAGADIQAVAPRAARVLLATGDVASALPYLERAAAADPLLRTDLAGVYARLGRADDARNTVAAAEQHLRERVEEHPHDRDLRVKWVTCLLNLGRTDEAIVALEYAGRDGLVGHPASGDLYMLACLAREREVAGGPVDGRLAWIRRALEIRPRSEVVLLRLVEMSQEASAGEGAAEADRLLAASLAGGEIPPAVSIALGTRAWKEGKLDEARAHLERAYQADPSNVVAANNVAWLLGRGTGPDLDRALAIADRLVAKHPAAAQFRDTRGQILAKLGRWDEALSELERALPGMRDSVETRRALAEAYRHAGRENLAELQDREADRLEAEASPKNDADRGKKPSP